MKSKMIALISVLMTACAFGQSQNPIATLGSHRIGGYLGLGVKSASVFAESAGFGDARAAITINGKWAIGLAGSGLYYDKKLTTLVQDGSYHLYAGYSGLFIERLFTVGQNTKINLSWLMAHGLAYYQYDKDFRRNKVWSEEWIDAVEFYMNEPCVELQQRLTGRIWLAVSASYRWSSPLWLLAAPEDLLRGLSAGINVKYAIY